GVRGRAPGRRAGLAGLSYGTSPPWPIDLFLYKERRSRRPQGYGKNYCAADRFCLGSKRPFGSTGRRTVDPAHENPDSCQSRRARIKSQDRVVPSGSEWRSDMYVGIDVSKDHLDVARRTELWRL